MKKIRHTDSQILSILKQNEMGKSVPDLFREHGMSSACFYQWRSKYGGIDASLMKRRKELEEENRQLSIDPVNTLMVPAVAFDITKV
jgi:putative transposase